MGFPSFKDYINEEKDVVYFTFSKMNPPTTAHEKILDRVSEESGKSAYKIYLSTHSDNGDSNPLVYENKIKYSRKAFPKHARSIIVNERIKNPLDVLSELYSLGYKKVVMVAGSERVNEYNTKLNLYNGEEGRHGFYNFKEGVTVISAGVKDADGTLNHQVCDYVKDGDFRSFSQYIPESLNNTESKKLFNEMRINFGLTEQTEFKRHIQLEPVSEERELFVKGNLFQIGDEVVIKETSEVGTISILGANYVIVEVNGNKYRKWLHDIELVEEGQPDWGTPESTKKAVSMTPGQVNPTKALEVFRKKKRKELKSVAGDVMGENKTLKFRFKSKDNKGK